MGFSNHIDPYSYPDQVSIVGGPHPGREADAAGGSTSCRRQQERQTDGCGEAWRPTDTATLWTARATNALPSSTGHEALRGRFDESSSACGWKAADKRSKEEDAVCHHGDGLGAGDAPRG